MRAQEPFDKKNIGRYILGGCRIALTPPIDHRPDAARHMLHEIEATDEFDDLPLRDVGDHGLLDPHIQFLDRHVPPNMRMDPTNGACIVIKCLQWFDKHIVICAPD